VFSGSIVRQGEIGALVYATGANTYFGKTAQLVQEAHTVSHFQRAVLKIGDYLIILAVWGYALAWFLVNDRVKLLASRIMDRERPLLSTRLALTGDER
jgi:magnesium-transporting ATPase (P-type)